MKQSSLGGKENGTSKKMVADELRRKSKHCANIDDPNKSNDNGNGVTEKSAINGNTNKHAKLNRQSSGETSIDDVNNKLTSHAFQSYDEQEHLESKEIQSPTVEDIPIA